MINKYFLLLIFSAFSASAIAAQSKEKPLIFTLSENKMLTEDKIHRELWSLSKVEWVRYRKLMKGIRGSISPKNISPLEVLGTHARNDTERRKYAEKWAVMRHNDISNILAFQLAYNKAFAMLYPNEQMINTQLLGLDSDNNNSFQATDRLLVFLKIGQCLACDDMIERIMKEQVIHAVHIDIYFTDTKHRTDDNKIRKWAKRHNINAKHLDSGIVTLNHDDGALFKLTKTKRNSIPLVFRYNSTGVTKVQY